MQLQLVKTYFATDLGVRSVDDGLALVLANGSAQLLYSEAELNVAKSLSLGAIGAPGSGYVSNQSLVAQVSVANLQPGSSMAFQTSGSTIRAFLFDAHGGNLTSAVISASGVPGNATTVTTSVGALAGVETFAIMGGASGDCAVLSQWNKAGLQVFHLAGDGSLVYENVIQDSAKSYLGNISDTASVSIAGRDYLLTLSSLENGITSFQMAGDDSMALVDSLGPHDMFAVSGPAALQVLELEGVTYAVVASTGSSSLTVVRVNDLGCLFQTDHVIDDLTTRFEHPEVLDSFTLQGREFVVSAGTDAGVSVMELLPGGTLSPFFTVALETGAGLYDVTGLEVAVNGMVLDIYVVDARADRIQKFEMSLANLGGCIHATGSSTTGTTKDDLIMGTAANETLQGGAGDDWLFTGGGTDALTGGTGLDVFVFDASATSGRITDYELHHDRIDLSDWGNIYDVGALQITATASGAILKFGSHQLALTAADGHSLSAASFAQSDFLF